MIQYPVLIGNDIAISLDKLKESLSRRYDLDYFIITEVEWNEDHGSITIKADDALLTTHLIKVNIL